jgi:hypothetical protein
MPPSVQNILLLGTYAFGLSMAHWSLRTAPIHDSTLAQLVFLIEVYGIVSFILMVQLPKERFAAGVWSYLTPACVLGLSAMMTLHGITESVLVNALILTSGVWAIWGWRGSRKAT